MMRLTLRCALMVCLALSVLVLAQAQSADELRKKYGEPLEAFEVRPHVLVTVKYGKDGKVSEYVIEGRRASQDEVVAFSSLPMSDKTALEVADELVPASMRGIKINDSLMMSGCSGITVQWYEHVEIQTFFACSMADEDGNVESVVIRWKDRTGMRPVPRDFLQSKGISQ